MSINTLNTLSLRLLLFCCLSSSLLVAQPVAYIDYEWEPQPKLAELSEEESKESAIMLKDFKGIAYAFDEAEQLSAYTLEHKIYRLNTDNAIERYNKVYIPFWEGNEVLRVMARVIKPSGEVVELDANNIKEVKDEETGGQYKMFAMEGVEQGGEIEYFYLLKSNSQANLFGGREFFQYGLPSRNVEFELIAPTHLEFLAKGYNGFPQPEEVEQDEDAEIRILRARLDSVEKIKEETFAMYHASRKRVEYKLGYNRAGNSGRLYTWSDAATRIFDNLTVTDKATLKTVAKKYKEMKLSKLSTKEQIRAIENYIKTNIGIQRGFDPAFYDVEKILANKYGNEQGIMRLYTSLFRESGIEYEIVLTSDRSNARFDSDFESWKYLDNYAFYFPSENTFIAPTQVEMRFGMIPYYWTEQDGLFIKAVEVGEYVTGIGQTKFIPALPYDQNFDNFTMNIEFDEDMSGADISITSKVGGYTAAAIQPYYPFIPEDKRKEVMESLIERYAEGAEFKDVSVENGEKNLSPLEKPFIVKGHGTASSFIQKAGPKYLFKIGDVIGEQTEMYQESERQNEIENDFNRLYDRTITFNIPEGYQVKNLDDLSMEVFYELNGERTCTFESSYKVEGDKVIVKVYEYYKQIRYDKKDFEPFRAVVNAAADFNKIVLVLEKK